MRKERRDLLSRNGFKVTTVREFLDLSPYEEAVIEIRLALSQELKKRRLEANKSQMTFAKELNTSQSRLAKMEAGEKIVSLDLLIKGLEGGNKSRRTFEIVSLRYPSDYRSKLMLTEHRTPDHCSVQLSRFSLHQKDGISDAKSVILADALGGDRLRQGFV